MTGGALRCTGPSRRGSCLAVRRHKEPRHEGHEGPEEGNAEKDGGSSHVHLAHPASTRTGTRPMNSPPELPKIMVAETANALHALNSACPCMRSVRLRPPRRTAPSPPVPANGDADVWWQIGFGACGFVRLCARRSVVGYPDLDVLRIFSNSCANDCGSFIDRGEAPREEIPGPVPQHLRPGPKLIVDFGGFQAAWPPLHQLGRTSF